MVATSDPPSVHLSIHGSIFSQTSYLYPVFHLELKASPDHPPCHLHLSYHECRFLFLAWRVTHRLDLVLAAAAELSQELLPGIFGKPLAVPMAPGDGALAICLPFSVAGASEIHFQVLIMSGQ